MTLWVQVCLVYRGHVGKGYLLGGIYEGFQGKG